MKFRIGSVVLVRTENLFTLVQVTEKYKPYICGFVLDTDSTIFDGGDNYFIFNQEHIESVEEY